MHHRSSFGRPALVAAALAATQLTLLAGQTRAQRRPTTVRGSVSVHYDDHGARRSPAISLMVGTFRSDLGSGEASPMVALRHEWSLSRWLLTEAGATYTRPSVTQIVPGAGTGGADLEREGYANAGGLDVSIQAQLPSGKFRPYVGLGTGIFGYSEPNDGEKFVRPSQQLFGGVRFWLTDRLAFRGEGRVRFDAHSSGYTKHNTEIAGGLAVRY
jgi:hypothetical protein